jgi:hypothetical protein
MASSTESFILSNARIHATIMFKNEEAAHLDSTMKFKQSLASNNRWQLMKNSQNCIIAKFNKLDSNDSRTTSEEAYYQILSNAIKNADKAVTHAYEDAMACAQIAKAAHTMIDIHHGLAIKAKCNIVEIIQETYSNQ